MGTEPKRASEWTIHGERVLDDTRKAVLSIADVELPDGVRENVVYLARGADCTGSIPDINEAERIAWIPLTEVQRHLDDGSVVGAGSVAGLLAVLLRQAQGKLKTDMDSSASPTSLGPATVVAQSGIRAPDSALAYHQQPQW